MAEPGKSPWTRWILLITLLLPLGFYFFLYTGTQQKFEHVPYSYKIKSGDTVFHRLPAFDLVRTDQQSITDQDVESYISIICFFAVGDDADKKTTVLFGNLQRIYDNVDWEMNPPFRFVAINTGDSASLAAAFEAKRTRETKVEPEKWWTLTGEQADVAAIGKSMGLEDFAYKDSVYRPFTSQVAALVDKEGRVRKLYVATDLQEERKIQEDLITLLRLDYPEEIKRMRAN